ncbi:hypothetical protein HJFPF1_05311 [Paramyrothecium foliicola]|nr:hypothetical protein HJFPF1_05311 [Paramyrothecium foliicola]
MYGLRLQTRSQINHNLVLPAALPSRARMGAVAQANHVDRGFLQPLRALETVIIAAEREKLTRTGPISDLDPDHGSRVRHGQKGKGGGGALGWI